MKKIISMLLTVVIVVLTVTANTGCFFSTDMKTQEITGVSSSYTKELNAEDFTLNAQAMGKLSFESSDEYVATVTQEGVVDVKNVGTAIIIIKAEATEMYQEAFKMVKIYVEDVNSNTISSKDPSNTITSDVICETTDSNVTCKSMACEFPTYIGKVCAIFKNYNNYPVKINVTCVFYDENGKMLETKTNSIFCLGYLESGVSAFNQPSFPEGYKTLTYAKYKITYTVEPKSSAYSTYTSYNNKIKVLSTVEGEDKLSVEVKNASGKTLHHSPYFAIVFYNEKDQLIGYRFTSVEPEIKEPGTIGYFSTYYPYDSVTHQYVKPARFEIYPTSAYTVKYLSLIHI